jgi:hypothetical protein
MLPHARVAVARYGNSFSGLSHEGLLELPGDPIRSFRSPRPVELHGIALRRFESHHERALVAFSSHEEVGQLWSPSRTACPSPSSNAQSHLKLAIQYAQASLLKSP